MPDRDKSVAHEGTTPFQAAREHINLAVFCGIRPGSQGIHCHCISSSWIVKHTFSGLNADHNNKFYWAMSHSSFPLQSDIFQDINWNREWGSYQQGPSGPATLLGFPLSIASPCALLCFLSFFTSNTFHHLPANRALWKGFQWTLFSNVKHKIKSKSVNALKSRVWSAHMFSWSDISYEGFFYFIFLEN